MLEPVRDYELRVFFTYVVEVLERLGIPYMVVGGFAATLYGEPRLTLDVDIVVDMKVAHLAPFLAAFPVSDYYASEEGIRDSLRRRYPFNVIQPTTGAKVDLVPLPRDALTLGAFKRRQRMVYDEVGHSATFISVEDIVIAKLRAYHETGSEKHLRDAQGVLASRGQDLDMQTLRRRALASGMSGLLERALEAARGEPD